MALSRVLVAVTLLALGLVLLGCLAGGATDTSRLTPVAGHGAHGVLQAAGRGAIGFSSTGVLICYSIANASAWTLPGPGRRWRRMVAALGVFGGVVLVAAWPLTSVLSGTAVLATGLAGRALRRSRATLP